jgi:hypothetical protein
MSISLDVHFALGKAACDPGGDATFVGTRTVSCFMGCSALHSDSRLSVQRFREVRDEFVNDSRGDMRHNGDVTNAILRRDNPLLHHRCGRTWKDHGDGVLVPPGVNAVCLELLHRIFCPIEAAAHHVLHPVATQRAQAMPEDKR